MPQSEARIRTSAMLNCHACNRRFPLSEFSMELNEEWHYCCPECGSEFVELLNQANQAFNSHATGTSAMASGLSSAGSDPPGNPGIGGSRGVGPGRAPRIEVHAMFHPDSRDVPAMPLGFVDAISRFAPLNLPNGQQAFVLQVQDGALLSPFTMGIPFNDALAVNPGDWVVGDDLDAVVSRVLDAYMPPRRATSQDVRDSLPRLRVRPGPLSPLPTATVEAAFLAASNSITNPRSATTAAIGGGESVDGKDDSGDGTNDSASRIGGAMAVDFCGQDAVNGSEKKIDVCPSPFSASMGLSVASCGEATAAPITAAADGYASCQPGELCTVCHDAFEPAAEVVELPCHHCFHEDCILPWLQQQNTCPVCRTRLVEGSRASGLQLQRQQASSEQDGPRVNVTGERRERTSPARGMGRDGGTNDVADWARSQLTLPLPSPRRPAGGAAADSSRPRLVPPPHLHPQQREGTRPAAHFPILGALVPPSSGPMVIPSLFTADERRMAENALAPLRTRFPSIQLINGLVPAPGASVGIAMHPLGITAAAPVRRPQLRNPSGDSVQQQQQQGHGQGTTTALRGGFFNNPMLNLYGESSEMGLEVRGNGGGAATGGSRSALRGGFFASGGAAAPSMASQRASGGSSTMATGNGASGALPVRRPRQPPMLSPQQDSSDDSGSAGGPAATGTAHTPEMRPDMLPAILWSVGARQIEGASTGTATSQGNTLELPRTLLAAAATAARTHAQTQPGSPSPSKPQTGARTAAAAGLGPQGSRDRNSTNDSQTAVGSITSTDMLMQQLGRIILGTALPGRSELVSMQQQALESQAPNLSPEATEGHFLHVAEMTSLAQQSRRTMEGDVPFAPHPAPTAAAVTAPSRDPSIASVAPADAMPNCASPDSAAQCSHSEVEGGKEGGKAASIDEGPSRQVARHMHEQDAATLAHQNKSNFSSSIDRTADCGKAAERSDDLNPGTSTGSGKRSSRHGGVSDQIETHGQGATAKQCSSALVHMGEVDSPLGAVSGHETICPRSRGPGAGSTKVRTVRKGRVGDINGRGTLTPASGIPPVTERPGDRHRVASEARIEGPAEGRSRRSGRPAAAAKIPIGTHDLANNNSGGSGGGGGGFNPLAAVLGGAGAGLRLLGVVAGNILRRGLVSSGSHGNRPGNTNGQGQAGGSSIAAGAARERQQ